MDPGGWEIMTDDHVADAATHLSDYTEEAEQIIRAELRAGAWPNPL
jgi:hypothetical protein